MAKRRVVITGMGMVSPLGLNMEDSWRAIVAGKSGVNAVTGIDNIPESFSRICASVKNFDPIPYFPSIKDIRKTDLFIQYGVAAARQAVENSKIVIDPKNAHRCGVAIGSGIGGLPYIERSYQILIDSGARRIAPTFIPGAIINMISGHVSIIYGMKGPNFAVVTACTTGTHNIGIAARTIAYNDADVMVAGGSEMASSSLGLNGFSAMRALSTRNNEPEKASRPWDRDRDGFVLGEGAGVIVLEEYEHAKRRGAHIYAELRGFGMSGDAYHMTMPAGEGASSAMQNALHDAALEPSVIDYINAHATSTLAGDRVEVEAVKQIFGKHAYKLAMSSTKSMTGHLLGAAGAVEAIFSVLSIRDQVAPPTINLDNPEPGCDINLVPHKSQKMKIDIALSNSFGFGGTNGSLIFSRVD